jgi:hypothetical protein
VCAIRKHLGIEPKIAAQCRDQTGLCTVRQTVASADAGTSAFEAWADLSAATDDAVSHNADVQLCWSVRVDSGQTSAISYTSEWSELAALTKMPAIRAAYGDASKSRDLHNLPGPRNALSRFPG